MKKITQKRNLLLGIFCILFSLILIPAPQAHAASTKTKAIKAYQKMMSQKTITWEKEYNFKVPTKNCSFALAYIDKDSVPELIVQNTNDIPHAGDWGHLYTYYKGKVRLVTGLNINDGKFYYYKKKAVFLDNYCGMGLDSTTYQKMSKTKAAPILNYEKNINPYAAKKVTYSKATKQGFTTVSKSYFNNKLKSYVKSTKKTKAKFYKNTSKNRKKYMK